MTLTGCGFVVFLLFLPVIRGQHGWGVTYTSTQICALVGSTVEIHCSYTLPSTINPLTAAEHTVWFSRVGEGGPADLSTDLRYSGRVRYYSGKNTCTLSITDLRYSDSAVYMLVFTSDQSDESFAGSPGVTLSVTDPDLQVKISPSPYSTWAVLTCHSSCRLPDPSSFVWYKNGKRYRETPSTLSDYFSSADSFSCAVRGREDFPSPSKCVHKQTCNRVTYSDRSICAAKGSMVDISCTYSSYKGNVESKIWFNPKRSPEDLSEDSQYGGRVQVIGRKGGRSTLRISGLRESDSAEYRFKFQSGPFEWQSSLPGTSLTVTALQVQVSRATGHRYDTEAELTCLSSCSPAAGLSFVWFKNGEELWRVEGSSYTDRFYPGDIISCALKGHENYRSPSVYAPKLPSVSMSPTGDVMEGSSVNLSCSSDANPAANYTWYKENQTRLSENPQLVLSSIQSSESGQYYCVAENLLGKTTSGHISVDVKYAPKLPSVSMSPPRDVMEGISVTLSCSSDANPAANYTWYKENQTLLHGPEGRYGFTSISSEDGGIYYCKAENQHGEINSSSLLVDVQYAPKLPSVSMSPPGDVMEGSSVTLSCSSDANPAANYTWYKENQDSPIASGQTFIIAYIRAEHSGIYYCEAQNTRGLHSNTFHLTVRAGALRSVAVGAAATVILAAVLLSVVILIRRKKAATRSSEPEERAHYRKRDYDDQEDGLHYASVQFSECQAEALYSNIRPVRPTQHTDNKGVVYAEVRFNSSAPRSEEMNSAATNQT